MPSLLPTNSPKYARRLARVLNTKADVYHNGRRLYLADGSFKVIVGSTVDGDVASIEFIPNAIARNTMERIVINPDLLQDGHGRAICASRSPR